MGAGGREESYFTHNLYIRTGRNFFKHLNCYIALFRFAVSLDVARKKLKESGITIRFLDWQTNRAAVYRKGRLMSESSFFYGVSTESKSRSYKRLKNWYLDDDFRTCKIRTYKSQIKVIYFKVITLGNVSFIPMMLAFQNLWGTFQRLQSKTFGIFFSILWSSKPLICARECAF